MLQHCEGFREEVSFGEGVFASGDQERGNARVH